MRHNAEDRYHKGEAIDEPEKGLEANDGVDKTCEQALGDNRMLFDKLRQIIEPRSF